MDRTLTSIPPVSVGGRPLGVGVYKVLPDLVAVRGVAAATLTHISGGARGIHQVHVQETGDPSDPQWRRAHYVSVNRPHGYEAATRVAPVAY